MQTYTYTHTQGCLKKYLNAVHNKFLLVVSFKIHSLQIYARGPVFLPLLKLILELCVQDGQSLLLNFWDILVTIFSWLKMQQEHKPQQANTEDGVQQPLFHQHGLEVS